MGGGHSHIVHPGHALRRASCRNVKATCGLCGDPVGFNDMAYRCTDVACPAFFLHDACFRYPERIKTHFSGHNLALTAYADVTGGGCTVCGRTLDGFSHLYSCSQKKHLTCGGGGFRAHPRCGNLPQQTTPPPHGHQLVLREPGAAGRRRSCVMCNHASGGQARAWSYQCPVCPDKELCLVCELGVDDGLRCCGCNQCVCGAGCCIICAGPAGLAVGNFLHELFRGCTGLSVKPLVKSLTSPARLQ